MQPNMNRKAFRCKPFLASCLHTDKQLQVLLRKRSIEFRVAMAKRWVTVVSQCLNQQLQQLRYEQCNYGGCRPWFYPHLACKDSCCWTEQTKSYRCISGKDMVGCALMASIVCDMRAKSSANGVRCMDLLNFGCAHRIRYKCSAPLQ